MTVRLRSKIAAPRDGGFRLALVGGSRAIGFLAIGLKRLSQGWK